MNADPRTRREAMEAATSELRGAKGCARENPRREASLLLQAALGVDRAQILAQGHAVVAGADLDRFRAMVEQRARGVPLPLIVGETGFHEITLSVESGVFIPRPETELLVEEARREVARVLERRGREGSLIPVRVLDLCTGSGAIAVALAAAHRGDSAVRVHAGDWNPRAVRLARDNADRNEVAGQVDVRRSNLFSAFADLEGKVDVLVSNPPYIAPDEGEALPLEVRIGDPREALFDPEGGTGFHRRIASRGRDFLRPGGFVLFEIGETQGPEVETLLARSGFGEVGILPDLAGRDRVVHGRREVREETGAGIHAGSGFDRRE